ncbi:hypothetical protein [Actinomadura sp.]|uniref:hypothetical protein n=2 Tax=Actinomadura sp. TaxID=1989 RepID=UPI0037CC68D1
MTSTAPRPGWVLVLTSTAYFMVVLDSSVVLTALPRMRLDLHADLASLQWTVNAYGIAFAAGIITAAALGDRFGRLGSPDAVTAGFRAALWSAVVFAALAAACSTAIASRVPAGAAEARPADTLTNA